MTMDLKWMGALGKPSFGKIGTLSKDKMEDGIQQF